MKIQIKLDKRKNGQTADGFPIVVHIKKYKQRAKVIRTGYYAKDSQFNNQLAQVTKKHPDYYLVNDFLENLRIKIRNIILLNQKSNLTLEQTAAKLFVKNYTIFSEAAYNAIKNPKESAYAAVKSFNAYYPKVAFDEVTAQMVKIWINQLLAKGNKPGGVDSYVRSLRALWNKLTDTPNPFKGHRIDIPRKIKVVATLEDLQLLAKAELRYTGVYGSAGRYRDYFLLMFYLGGIDTEVLARLRYDVHVIGNRIQFNRNKGQSKVACNNVIPAPAWQILEQYNCKPYLVPIYQANNYKYFTDNFRNRLKKLSRELKLTNELRPKSARYTFINRAKELFIDQRLTGQIVGHTIMNTTSLYENDYPLSIQDTAHLKIIEL